ncbi:sodium/pantothenate symporter [Fictibacillus sp. WQ 8-8]|uniref:sodium/pantothenate symporter n=1 Tax=unclassified Fictibacillus TaxID=2644029 RepID=UPI0008E1CE43|nr:MULTISPECIES: sodium/pantothenate symporter [unclassified Fictibacillus]MCQ6264834.1 sodium/pantothenate symporter [Fictibacillus sp. WQ 8-8]MED2970808.1 sodium/pantothenate symporter [Fictibacillus sp. B-59209]SFE87487.1 sodium/pantothenate symporter [Bacillus sp. OV194]
MNWEVVIPLLAFLIGMFVVGIYTSRQVQSGSGFLQDYFLGGRHLGGFVLALTMVATYGSASSFIGGPGIAYKLGLGWVLLAMAQLVTGYFTLAVLGKKFAIVARKIDAVTLIDFLKARYENKWVVIFSAASISIFLFSATAAQWVGGGRLIESFTGVSYPVALLIFSFSVLVYVIAGGFRAVVITDTLMGIVMFIGTLVILAGTIIAGGGVPHIISTLAAENPNLISPYGADKSLTPLYVSSFWLLVGVGVVGLPQISVRAMSYRNSKAMHQAMIIGTFVVGFIMLGMHLTGVFARVVIPGVEIGDKVMPMLALKVLPGWLAGIVLAAPLAAVMSTVNAILLIVSSSIVKDIYINYIKPEASQQSVKRLSFSVTAIIGILVFIMALNPPDLLIWLNLFSFGGLEAAFIWPVVLGLYWRRGNAAGAVGSIVTGVLSYILLDTFAPNLWGMHTVVLPVVLSLAAYILLSLVSKNSPQSSLAKQGII